MTVPDVSLIASSQKPIKLGMEGHRFDAPDLRPFDGAVLFAREALAGFSRVLIHLRKDRGVEIALIERCFARPTTAVTMPGKVFRLPMVQTASGCFFAMVADFEGEFRGGGKRVAAGVHRRGTGVRFLAVRR